MGGGGGDGEGGRDDVEKVGRTSGKILATPLNHLNQLQEKAVYRNSGNRISYSDGFSQLNLSKDRHHSSLFFVQHDDNSATTLPPIRLI